MLVSVIFYIFLNVGEKDRSDNLNQREGHAIIQRFPDFDSC